LKKKPTLLGQCSKELTKTELEIFHLLTNEFLTPRKIAIRRKVKVSGIYQHIRNIKKKGYLSKTSKTLHKKGGTIAYNEVRLHNQQFRINILYKDERYKDILKKNNLLMIDGNTIQCFKDCIVISGGMSFYGDDVFKVTAKSMKYWNRLFYRLENDLNVILIKPRTNNIKHYNSHYAEINNEIAKEYNITGDKLRIYANDDGKLWCLIDKSFNKDELECVHPETSMFDMDKVKKVFNDYRDHPSLHLPNEIEGYLKNTDKLLMETQNQLKVMAELQFNTQRQFKALLEVLTPKVETPNEKKDSSLTNYFG
jgi:DNA-binding CsgD family transcriptional regulator